MSEEHPKAIRERVLFAARNAGATVESARIIAKWRPMTGRNEFWRIIIGQIIDSGCLCIKLLSHRQHPKRDRTFFKVLDLTDTTAEVLAYRNSRKVAYVRETIPLGEITELAIGLMPNNDLPERA